MTRNSLGRWHSLALAGLAIAAPALAADGLDIRTGLWETTIVSNVQGGVPVPPSVLARMSPEQRAKVLASSKQAAARGPTTRTFKNCVTPADLKEGAFKVDDEEEDDDGACTQKIVAHTRTLQQATLSCSGEMPRTGSIRIEAIDREHVKGSIENNAGDSHITSQVSARWLGNDCKGVDD